MDGFGLAQPASDNAVLLADMKYFNSLINKFPSFSLAAAGLMVGLPWGKAGNSEVGHSAIGTGRVIVQEWARINSDITTGDFFKNKAFLDAIGHCKKHDSKLHFIGLASPGGIHSHEEHLFALLRLAEEKSVPQIFVHLITDGEDVPQSECLESLKRLQPFLKKSGARIATIAGRAFSMDRVLNWNMTEKSWKAMAEGKGSAITDPSGYLSDSHKKNIGDENIEPAVVVDQKNIPVGLIAEDDALIFFNFRNDRMKQLVSSFAKKPKNLFIATMTRYGYDIPVNAVAYEPPVIHKTLGKIFCDRQLKQLRIAEKEKEAHVSNFFNGGRIDPYEGEKHIIVPSKKVENQSLAKFPEMSANDIVKTVQKAMDENYALHVINFANADMIGHTGDLKASVAAVKVLDKSLEQIIEPILKKPDWLAVVTCDHGNAEQLQDPLTRERETQHSTANVPAVFIGNGLELKEPSKKTLENLADDEQAGGLIDIAPSILKLMGIEKPSEMTGTSLI